MPIGGSSLLLNPCNTLPFDFDFVCLEAIANCAQSFLFWDHSGWLLDHMGTLRLNQGHPYTRQIPYSLCYSSDLNMLPLGNLHTQAYRQIDVSIHDDSSGMCLALVAQTVLQEVANTMNHLKPLMKQLENVERTIHQL